MVAAALGALLGVLLIVGSRRAVAFVTPEDALLGVVIVGGMMVARFAVAIAALAAYHFFAPDGLAPFGVFLSVAFVAGLAVEAVKSVRPHASTSA